MSSFAYETFFLGLRTSRRFIRIPSNWISIIFFPLIQLLVFSQLYKDIVQLPNFGPRTSYLAYLAPGQVAFTALMAVAWSAYGLIMEYRTGYLDKLRAYPIGRWSILAGEMVPLFFQAALMAGIVLVVSLLFGAGIAVVLGPGGGVTIRGASEHAHINALTALAGPPANLVLGIACGWVATQVAGDALAFGLLLQVAVLQLITSAANLPPFGQFDGSRIFAMRRGVPSHQ